MPAGFFAREWERTCAECGYTWRVPRSIARGGIRGSMGVNARAAKMSPRYGGEYRADVEARAELMEGYRTCAKCGADHFTQRPVTRRG